MASDTDSTAGIDESAVAMPRSQAIMAYKLLRAKTKADKAELDRRAAMMRFRPSRMYPCVLYHDGLRWACEYVSGFGTRQEEEGTPLIAYGMFPEEAMQNYDAFWIGMDVTPEPDETGDVGDEDM